MSHLFYPAEFKWSTAVGVCVCHPSPRAVQTSTVFDADLTSQCADAALHASAIPSNTHEATHNWRSWIKKKWHHIIIRFFYACRTQKLLNWMTEVTTVTCIDRVSHMWSNACPWCELVWPPKQEQVGSSITSFLTSGWLMQIDVFVCVCVYFVSMCLCPHSDHVFLTWLTLFRSELWGKSQSLDDAVLRFQIN